jgi:hypothetical protein
LSIAKPSWPRFRAINEEVVSLDDDFGPDFPGVLVDASGAVRALWAAYILGHSHEDEAWVFGLPAALFAPPIAAMVAARDAAGAPSRGLGAFAAAAAPRFLDVELEAVSLSDAGGLGLSAAWVDALAAADAARATALRVVGVPLGSPARGVLRAGDFLLRVNGAAVTAFSHVEDAAAAALRWARKRAGRALGARWARAAAQAASCSVRCVTRARTCMQLLAGAQVPVVDVCVARVLSGRRRPVRDAYAVRTLHARLAAACACSCQLQNCARSGPSLTPPGRGAPRSEISHVLRDAYWRDDLRAAADQKYARHGGLLAYLGEHGGWGVIENQPKDPREDEYAASKAARLQLRADAAAAKVARAAAKAAKAVATAAAKAAREEARAAREAEKAERESQRTQKQAARPAHTRDAGAAGDAPTAAKRPKKDEAASTAVPAAAAV